MLLNNNLHMHAKISWCAESYAISFGNSVEREYIHNY